MHSRASHSASSHAPSMPGIYVEPFLCHVADKLSMAPKEKCLKNCQRHPAFGGLVDEIEPPQATIDKFIRLVGDVRGMAVDRVPRPQNSHVQYALVGLGCETREAKRSRCSLMEEKKNLLDQFVTKTY